MYSYTLTFKEEVDKLTAPEQEIRLQSPAQAGDFIIHLRWQPPSGDVCHPPRPLQQPLSR